MLLIDQKAETEGLIQAARQICIAARTAPKGRGKDLLVTAIVADGEKDRIAQRMRVIARRDEVAFFSRDAGNVDASPVLVLFGSRTDPMKLPHCGFCGFADCDSVGRNYKTDGNDNYADRLYGISCDADYIGEQIVHRMSLAILKIRLTQHILNACQFSPCIHHI